MKTTSKCPSCGCIVGDICPPNTKQLLCQNCRFPTVETSRPNSTSERFEPASQKQVAYLEYLGVKPAKNLSKDEAHQAIETFFLKGSAEQLQALEAKNLNWTVDRYRLFPNLYRAEPATKKQVAYLKYMGVKAAENLAKHEAHYAIETMFSVGTEKQLEELAAKQFKWNTDRFVLFPNLYRAAFKKMLTEELPAKLHTFVRSKVVRASEKLTRERILSVINSLTANDRIWWSREDWKEHFYEHLKISFPGCCDGILPSDDRYFFSDGISDFGPHSLNQMKVLFRTGYIGMQMLVHRHGECSWHELSQFPEIVSD